jgi:hypothetical protein
MADVLSGISDDAGLAFMVSAGLVYEVVAAACSSPQTTEINAGSRADTLMKWVYLGLGQSVLLVGIGAHLSKHPQAVILGGTVAGTMMLASYLHAKDAGLKSSKPGTEPRMGVVR